MNDVIIDTHGLSKSYSGKPALRSLDLTVPSGAIYGFLGRNGAGKTTTLKLLLGMIRPDAGEFSLFGERVKSEASAIAARRRLAFVSEDKELYPFMTVGQTIRFTRAFFPAWRRDLEKKYLDMFRLPLETAVPKLSQGNAHTAHAAAGDGAWRRVADDGRAHKWARSRGDGRYSAGSCGIWRLATKQQIFFSSHQLAEVEQICDRVCIIDEGQVVIDGVLDDLKSEYRRIVLVFEGSRHRSCRLAGR